MSKDCKFWMKGNKDAQKWTETQVEKILQDTYKYIKANEAIKLITEAELYMLETHSVGHDTWYGWINALYVDNKCIQRLWQAIRATIEVRVVYDQDKMRPAIQGMVLQNKHDYRDRKEQELKGKISFADMIKEANE